MGEFTRAVFAAKELFGADELKQLSVVEGANVYNWVATRVPDSVTRVSVREIKDDKLSVDLDSKDDLMTQHDLFSPHARYPSLSSCVRVNYTAARGRHLTAARRIDRGEVVAVEEPVATFPVTRDWS